MNFAIKETKRESGIELLKIIGVFLIILCHSTQILIEGNLNLVDINKYDLDIFVLILFKYFGSIGNAIFMVCSFYFLVGKNELNKKRILNIIIDNFIVSIIFVFIYLFKNYEINSMEIIRNIFPTYFCTNWFISCYLILYTIHPLLNIVIDNIDKKKYEKYLIGALFIYCGLCNLVSSLYINDLIIFIIIYFLIGYIKTYESEIMNNKKTNVILLFVSFLLLIILILITYFINNKIIVGRIDVFHWNDIKNPLIIIIGLSLFNIFKTMKFKNNVVNYISSLSLLVYIIHSNGLYTFYSKEKNLFKFLSILKIRNVNGAILYSLSSFLICIVISIIYKLVKKSIIKVINHKIRKK